MSDREKEKSNYFNKIVNVYIANDLDDWPKNPGSNFNFKNCLFGATSIGKNSHKEKSMDLMPLSLEKYL